jgi:hypothetical protein
MELYSPVYSIKSTQSTMKIIRLISGLVFLLAGVFFIRQLVEMLYYLFRNEFSCIKYFLLGIGISLVFGWLSRRRTKASFLATFSHELTHAVFAWIHLCKVQGLSATAGEGGGILISGRLKGSFLIALSPYFFPLFTIILIVIKLIVIPPIYPFIDLLIGATLLFHLGVFKVQTSDIQTDIKMFGFFFSYSFIGLMNIIMLLLILSTFDCSPFSFTDILKMGWADIMGIINYF